MQRILWSPHSKQPSIEYKMNTVTYGTACAPYLAIRTLRQKATTQCSRYSLDSETLDVNTYVDDIFVRDDDFKIAVNKRREIIDPLSLPESLDKWSANNSRLLPPGKKRSNLDTLNSIEDEDTVKTLGVSWNAILISISNLFDPSGGSFR